MIKLRTPEEILEVVILEMRSYACGWRSDGSDFNGRVLQWQFDDLTEWAMLSLTTEMEEFTGGTEFRKLRSPYYKENKNEEA